MIGYTTLGTNDLPRACAFYDAVFAAIGIQRLGAFGDRGQSWGTGWDKPCFAVMTPHDGGAATAGNGSMVSLVVRTPEQVQALYAAAQSLGAADEGAPGPRGASGFHGAYFRDLDGNKLCVFCMVKPA